MTGEIKELFSQSEVGKASQGNTFLLVLDQQGKLVHSFHGLAAGRGATVGRSDYPAEIAKAFAKLQLSPDKLSEKERPAKLPDLPAVAQSPGAPAGLRLFIRGADEQGVPRGRSPVIELVPMTAEEWKPLAFPEKTREIDAAALRNLLVHMYPPAIRTVDQQKPFKTITGSLKLEPAGADQNARYALLCGSVQLAKGDDKESVFDGAVQVALTYGRDGQQVQSVRGVIEGDYIYRMRASRRIPLRAAIESRPD
jgi:hypothetical protein